MPELRECPFCGGELTCVSGTGVDLMTQDNRPYIGCKVCEWTLSGRRLTEIAKIINYRPTESALQNRVRELEEQLGAITYQVAMKYPNESRYETALRFVKERQEQIDMPTPPAKEDGDE